MQIICQQKTEIGPDVDELYFSGLPDPAQVACTSRVPNPCLTAWLEEMKESQLHLKPFTLPPAATALRSRLSIA